MNKLVNFCRNYFLLLHFLLASPLAASAEGLIIESFEATNDISATQVPRRDASGKICALVKILVIDKIISVDGNTVKDASGRMLVTKGMETWVWLVPGTKQIKVSTEEHGDTEILFSTYGIEEVSSSTTYYLTLLDEYSTSGGTGKLNINYMPINCDVLIDGIKIGTTPGVFKGLATGSHTVEIVKDGFDTSKERIIISSKKVATISGNLAKAKTPIASTDATTSVSNDVITGELIINHEPYDCEVLIDGLWLGRAPDRFTVCEGSYELEFRAFGFESEKRNITIGAGQTITIKGHLKANPEIVAKRHKFSVKGTDFYFVKVDSGILGPNSDHPDRNIEIPSFLLGQTEVTQALWKAVMGNNPSHFKGDNLPVDSVSYDECLGFIEKLNELTGMKFYLPSCHQWEHAITNGNLLENGYARDISYLGWLFGNSNGQTHPVATKLPGKYGLYDMYGNVAEWVYDKNKINTEEKTTIGFPYRKRWWGDINKLLTWSENKDTKKSHIGLRLAIDIIPQ